MAKDNRKYHVRFRCFFGGTRENSVDHNAELTLDDIPKWLRAYHFTHPGVHSITMKYWPNDREEESK